MTTLLFRPSGATVITPPEPVPERSSEGLANAVFDISYTDPNDEWEWEDESAFLRRVSFTRGSSDELEQPQAGRLQAVVNNRTGRFTPTNTVGPHYPNVLPVRSVRLAADTHSFAVPFTMRSSNVGGSDALRGGPISVALFTGYIEHWPQEWDRSDNDATAPIDASDAFALFNLAPFRWGDFYNTANPGVDDWPANATTGNATPDNGPPFIPDEPAAVRIHRALDATGWPVPLRQLGFSEVIILGSADSQGGTANLPVDTNVLEYIRGVALTDGGRVFMDPTGRVRFVDAAHPGDVAVEIYGDADGEVRYTDIQTSYGLDQLWNDVTVSVDVGGATAALNETDATSIERYYPRPKSVSLMYATEGEEDDGRGGTQPSFNAPVRAEELLARFKDPILRVRSLTFRPKTSQVLRAVLSHDLSDRVTVIRRPAVGDPIEQISRIDEISVTTENKFDWVITWELSAE